MSAIAHDHEPELELSYDELSMLFALKGWLWDLRGQAQPPNASDIERMLKYLAEVLSEAPQEKLFYSLGRFDVYKDPEFPDSYCVNLNLGVIPRRGD